MASFDKYQVGKVCEGVLIHQSNVCNKAAWKGVGGHFYNLKLINLKHLIYGTGYSVAV